MHEEPRPQRRSGLFMMRSGDANVLRLRALGALGEIELDLLVLVERLVATGLDGGEVDEHVLAAAVLRDEAEALLGVEPLDGALSHESVPSVRCRGPCALQPLKTSTCADVQRTQNQKSKIQAALRPRPGRLVKLAEPSLQQTQQYCIGHVVEFRPLAL